MKNVKNLVKKALVVVMVGVVGVTGLVGCGTTKEEKAPTEVTQPQLEENTEEEIDVKLEDFVVKGKLKKDSIGTTWFKATITNNSKYILKSAEYVYEYTNKEKEKDNTYLLFGDTLKPGKTSSTNECFGNKDMKLKTVFISLIDKENDREIIVSHDVELEETNISEMPR